MNLVPFPIKLRLLEFILKVKFSEQNKYLKQIFVLIEKGVIYIINDILYRKL